MKVEQEQSDGILTSLPHPPPDSTSPWKHHNSLEPRFPTSVRLQQSMLDAPLLRTALTASAAHTSTEAKKDSINMAAPQNPTGEQLKGLLDSVMKDATKQRENHAAQEAQLRSILDFLNTTSATLEDAKTQFEAMIISCRTIKDAIESNLVDNAKDHDVAYNILIELSKLVDEMLLTPKPLDAVKSAKTETNGTGTTTLNGNAVKETTTRNGTAIKESMAHNETVKAVPHIMAQKTTTPIADKFTGPQVSEAKNGAVQSISAKLKNAGAPTARASGKQFILE
jgi:hypothetical protein